MYKYIGDLDANVWHQDDFRTQLRGLGETQSILIQYDSQDPIHVQANIPIRFPEIHKELKPFLDYLLTLVPEKKIARIFIAKLPAGKSIDLHKDPAEYRNLSRYHWVLNTNNQCFMKFRRESVHFAEGEVWYFNNLEIHGAINQGPTDRLHLIIDFLK